MYLERMLSNYIFVYTCTLISLKNIKIVYSLTFAKKKFRLSVDVVECLTNISTNNVPYIRNVTTWFVSCN